MGFSFGNIYERSKSDFKIIDGSNLSCSSQIFPKKSSQKAKNSSVYRWVIIVFFSELLEKNIITLDFADLSIKIFGFKRLDKMK